jgi:hypothetical protein
VIRSKGAIAEALWGGQAGGRLLTPFASSLDQPLLQLGWKSVYTTRQAVCGLLGTGGLGSGKSSATAKAVALAYLKAGFGGIVLVAKPEEIQAWISYCRMTGRLRDLILFDGERHGFDFLSYEIARQGVNGTGAVVECLLHVLAAADHATGAGGQAKDEFWPQAIRQVLQYVVPVLYSAWGTVTVAQIIDFVVSAATKGEQYTGPGFQERSFAAKTLRKAVDSPSVRLPDDEQKTILEYWFIQYPAIPEKTRGNIVISLTTKLDRFKHGRMKRAFCGETTVVPEMTWHGKIILLAMPVLTWAEDGVVAQQLFKFMWQRAVESRNALAPIHRERPVFCFADEAQYFVNLKDDDFLSTCRASRACVVYLTQSIPTLYAKMGKEQEEAVNGLLGKFGNWVMHLNSCVKTNTYASQLIGRDLQWRATQGRSSGWNSSRGMNEGSNVNKGSSSSYGFSSSGSSGGSNSNSGSNKGSGSSWGENIGKGFNEGTSSSYAQTMDAALEPAFFSRHLKPGGPAYGNIVTAVWFRAGAVFPETGTNYMLVRFRQ